MPAASADPPKDDAPAQSAGTSGSKGAAVGDAIKRRLKTLYDGVTAEPVPARHKALLDELERKAGKDAAGSKDKDGKDKAGKTTR